MTNTEHRNAFGVHALHPRPEGRSPTRNLMEIAKPMKIDPQSWLTIANERAPRSTSVTNWFPGNTSPKIPGYYERHFTDGTALQWWNGNQWLAHDPAERRGSAPHWRQVGDYPSWRGMASSEAHESQSHTS